MFRQSWRHKFFHCTHYTVTFSTTKNYGKVLNGEIVESLGVKEVPGSNLSLECFTSGAPASSN